MRKKNPSLRLRRFFAFIIDLIIVDLLIVFPFKDILNHFISKPYDLLFNESISSAIVLIYSMIAIFVLFYFILLEYYTGQTIGKIVLNLRVIGLKSKEISFYQAFIRNSYLIPIFPFNLLLIIDLFMFITKGFRLSELLSQTKTIEVKE